MKTLFYLGLLTLTVQAVHAGDFSFAFEGDEQKRARLSSVQDTATPPSWHLSDWENSPELRLEDLRGKIIVVDFWATWCGPCISSIPKNNKIYEDFKDDVVFIGICHPQGSEKMSEVVKTKGIKYPVAIDPEGETIRAYAVDSYPDYYVFDREGKLVVADCANAQVGPVLTKLLSQ